MSDDLPITKRFSLPGHELSWTAVRASGPGGQNVNKVSSKVELRFDLGRSQALSEPVRRRLRLLAMARIDAMGQLVVVCQQERSQSRNLELAREKLAELVREALVVPKRRRPTTPSQGAIRRRLARKRRTAERKRDRRWSPD